MRSRVLTVKAIYNFCMSMSSKLDKDRDTGLSDNSWIILKQWSGHKIGQY